ncbi:hypothetical protein PHMEG_00028394 [Phytophthora megakarya]|uniref:Uncharacterized protein n=1 Tax=Phytophthora megakarya TaxID=4795 RepID=A0A225V6M5_9STRA|nr:hypothetical protein PHMEG_00028394 [Phytophthora megakarya]
MGRTNSVAYVQPTVQAIFGDLFNNGLLSRIDGLLGCEQFFLTEELWCERVVSVHGVRHDLARIEALRQLPAPSTGQNPQPFICALNWMRTSLPSFNKLIHPLQTFMENVYASAGGRMKTQVRRTVLENTPMCRW